MKPWPVEEYTRRSRCGDWVVTKMRFAKTGTAVDKSSIIYNSSLTLSGIPLEAYQYEVNGKSAIEWIMDRYQVKTDKASGIVNDPNRWAAEAGDPRYVVDLLRRIITVSVETVSIVNAMPPLTLASPGLSCAQVTHWLPDSATENLLHAGHEHGDRPPYGLSVRGGSGGEPRPSGWSRPPPGRPSRR